MIFKHNIHMAILASSYMNDNHVDNLVALGAQCISVGALHRMLDLRLVALVSRQRHPPPSLT